MMTLSVYKFQIYLQDAFVLNLPKGAKILKVALQRDIACLWALVDPLAPLEPRTFRMAGTGHPITEAVESLNYIDSFMMQNGALVFHVFEVKE